MARTILVVDDDHSVTSIFEFILQQAGYRTVITSSGEEALQALEKHHQIDLVFLDVKMPGISGIETLKRLQQKRPNLLVVMMTGYSVDELLNEAFKTGAYGVIYKPFDVEEVLSVIEKIFKLPFQKR